DGGKISLALTPPPSVREPGGEIVLGDGVNLFANGGAWLKPTGSLSGGQGGTINIDASPWGAALDVGNNVGLSAFGVQGDQGGQFSLAAPVINVSQGNGTWAAAQRVDYSPPDASGVTDPTPPTDDEPKVPPAFELGASLFSKYGFSSVSLT